jgi:hypothetical protein
MLDLESTSFVTSPEAAKAFAIPVMKRRKPIQSKDILGKVIYTEGLITVQLCLFFGNHQFFDEKDYAFEVIITSAKSDPLIPAWYLDKHKASGTTTSHLHFSYCSTDCFKHGKVHPQYSYTYDNRVSLSDKAIPVGVVVMSNPTLMQKLPAHYNKFMLLFVPEQSDILLDITGCDHRIKLLRSEDKLQMGPINQLSQDEEKLLLQYHNNMINGILQPSSSTVERPILFLPYPKGGGLRLCVDYQHLKDYTKQDQTPLPIMEELQSRFNGATLITKINLMSGLHLIRIPLGHEKFTVFRTKFGLY